MRLNCRYKWLLFCLDLKCYIDAVYLATATEIYVISGGVMTTLNSAINAKLAYDRIAERMLYFDDEGNTLYTMKLDGSNETVISDIQMEAFTIDDQSRFIYFTNPVDDILKGFPMSNSSSISDIIFDEGDIKDLAFDTVSR